MRRFIQVVISLSLLVIVLLLGVLPITRAATITVCASGCDYTTIQAAVNAADPDDTINIMAGTYVENVIVDKNLILQGTEKNNVTVNGNGTGSVFTIDTGAIVTIADMTITNGSANNGGGINNEGTLTLDNTIIINNNVVNRGGGVYNNGGVVAINNSTIANNSSLNGGGLMNDNGGVMTVNNSTINDNRRANGGGIRNGNGGLLTVNNSTISNNRSGFVGGIYSFSPITVTNSTIYSNTIFGFRVWSDTGTLKNTIVANNTVGDCEAVHGGVIVSLDYNLDSDGSCNLVAANDQPNTNPLLGPLADNGGDTLTHALMSNSPAIDKGSCSDISFDQRGQLRPIDTSGIINADDGCDIGAYESSFSDLALTKIVNPTTAVIPGTSITYTISFSNAGSSIATGVLISDIVPITLTNLNFISSGAPITNVGLSPNFSWQIGDLAPLQGGFITVTGQVDPSLVNDTIFTNTATITGSTVDLNITNNKAEAEVEVVVPKLSLSKTVIPDTNVPYRGEITYTIALSNNNAFNVTNTLLTDTLPISTTFARWIEQSGASESSNRIAWNGTVTAGQVITFSFVATHIGDYSDVVTNRAEYSHPNGSGSTQTIFTVEPLLSTVSISDATSLEGNTDLVNVVFTVTLSMPQATPVTVNYSTADNSATVTDNDYIAANGSITFAPGSTTQAISVTIIPDTKVEPDETFYVNLTSVSSLAVTGANTTIADGQGLGVIVNDDVSPSPLPRPDGGNDDDDRDEGSTRSSPTPPVPLSTATPLPVLYLPETGLYATMNIPAWPIVILVGLGVLAAWVIIRRWRY